MSLYLYNIEIVHTTGIGKIHRGDCMLRGQIEGGVRLRQCKRRKRKKRIKEK